MTISSLDEPRALAAGAKLPALVRAVAGLLIVGARHPGRPLCISRRTGKVTLR